LLQYWDVSSHGWKTATGTYGVAVGGSSAAPVATTFTIH
jgi:beta-glucosidase